MERCLHHVADLPDATRAAVEGLIGHPLSDEQFVYVATVGVREEPPPADRNAAWDELESIIGEMHRNAAKSGLSSEQIDALIDAECAAVRYSHRA